MKGSRIALAVLLVATALLMLVVYKRGIELFGINARVDMIRAKESERLRTIEKCNSLISKKQSLEKRLGLARQQFSEIESTKLIEGRTPSIAAAALQDVIKGIITGNGGTITSERAKKPEGFDRFDVVSVSFDAVVPNAAALHNVMFTVENYIPFMVIDDIDARVRNFKVPDELSVRLSVSSIMREGR
jgi:hypothetical protein